MPLAPTTPEVRRWIADYLARTPSEILRRRERARQRIIWPRPFPRR